MHPELKVYLDRLQGGKTENIELELSSAFLDVNEPDLKFGDTVTVKGKAYLASEHLVIELEIQAEAILPCAICNEPVREMLKISRMYHTEELEAIRGRVYNYTQPLREAILLEVPTFSECQGSCPQRKELDKYKPHEGKSDSVQFPFVDLN